MKFNGSTNIYVYGAEKVNKIRVDACKKLLDLYMPEHEKRKFTPIDAYMNVISTHHNFDDTKLILKRIINETKLVGVDILVVTFQTIFRGDSLRTAYKTCYTCGGEVVENHIFDLEEKVLLNEMVTGLPLSDDLRIALTEHEKKFGIIPMYKKHINYRASR